jgi:hypothetical protein
MRLLQRIVINLYDVLAFGPQFLLRHLPRLTKANFAKVYVQKIGPVYFRAGESDVAGFRQVFQDRAYSRSDPRLSARYQSILKAGKIPTIVDAGANVGAASLWFLQQFPEAAVVAIEPEPGNLSVLRKNAENRNRLTPRQLDAAPDSYY